MVQENRANNTELHLTQMTKPNTAIKAIRALMDQASTAQVWTGRVPAGFTEPTAFVKAPAGRAGVLNITTTQLPDFFDKEGQWKGIQPAAIPAGEVITMAGALAANSRAIKAGARLVIENPNDVQPINGVPGAVSRLVQQFTTVEAAPFGFVLEDAEVTAVELPAYRRLVEWGRAKPYAVRFEIKKSQRHAIGDDQIAAEILASIALGVPRAADAAFLAELGALDDLGLVEPFTIGKAAAAGLQFAELRALIGTAGNGALIGADGALAALPFTPTGYQAGGIPAELTAGTTATYLGAFDRAGIAVANEVTVTAARVDKAGTLAVTAWVNVLPLIPQPGKFWKAAA